MALVLYRRKGYRTHQMCLVLAGESIIRDNLHDARSTAVTSLCVGCTNKTKHKTQQWKHGNHDVNKCTTTAHISQPQLPRTATFAPRMRFAEVLNLPQQEKLNGYKKGSIFVFVKGSSIAILIYLLYWGYCLPRPYFRMSGKWPLPRTHWRSQQLVASWSLGERHWCS